MGEQIVAISHLVIKVPVTMEAMATDSTGDAIRQYIKALNLRGEQNWSAYHVAEVDDGVLVFLQQE